MARMWWASWNVAETCPPRSSTAPTATCPPLTSGCWTKAKKAYAIDDRVASAYAVLRLVKNRNGERASVLYHYVKAFNQFIPIEQDKGSGKWSGKLAWTGADLA